MAREIAVLLGEDMQTASLYDKGKIVIYQRRKGKWNTLREKCFTLDQNLSLKEIREQMKDVLVFLNECKVFVGLSIVGVPYFELEKAGFSIWEFEGKPMEFLDFVLAKEEEQQMAAADSGKPVTEIGPVEIGEGCFRLSLKDIQTNNLGVTSKQALLPFLRRGKFYELEVICDHVPPWLETELLSQNLSGEIERTGQNELRVIIAKKCCCDNSAFGDGLNIGG